MRRVAGRAAFHLHRFVLVDEWSLFVRVALKADEVLRGRGTQLSGEKPAVRIVAVRALHQSFIDTVMERSSELLLGFQVAAVTKQRLLFFHEELALFGMVRVVAIRAANVVL